MESKQPITDARLEGRTTVLRPIRPSDAAAAFSMLHGREPILRWLLWRGPTSEEELSRAYDSWVRESVARPTGTKREFLFAMEERATGAFLGTIGVDVTGEPARADLGYWIGERFWGRGFGTEAVGLAVAFAFRHLSATSVCAWVFVGNDPSRRILEKNGFRLAATVRDKLESDGKVRDEWSFVLLREEWERAGSPPSGISEEVRRG